MPAESKQPKPKPAERPSVRPSALVKYSFLQIMTGSDLSRRRLALMEARGLKPGPTAWLTACIHGDEAGGMVVVHEIFRRLRQAPLARGRLLAYPLMNPMGFESRSRQLTLSEEDLNRAFPGHPKGSLAQRLAHMIFTRIMETGPAAVLDLHNDWAGALPYAVLDPPLAGEPEDLDGRVMELARQTSLPIVRESAVGLDTIPAERTLSGSLRNAGIPALTIELGEANVINERDVENGVRCVWRVLAHLGLTATSCEPPELTLPEVTRDRELFYSHRPVSSSTGVIRFLTDAGAMVKAGQKIARVFNAFGKPIETLCAPGAGLVLGRSDSALSHPGAPVMAIGLLEKPQPEQTRG